MKNLLFLKCEIKNGKFKFSKLFFPCRTISSKGWEYNDSYHQAIFLEKKDFNTTWHNCFHGDFFSYIWCNENILKQAKIKCITELKNCLPKMKKYISEKEQELINYKKNAEFLSNYFNS